MEAKFIFDKLVNIVKKASEDRNANLIVYEVPKLDVEILGESNFMKLECRYKGKDNSAVDFHYHSYDPSGPFQNIPDINKIRILLYDKGVLIEEFKEEFSDRR